MYFLHPDIKSKNIRYKEIGFSTKLKEFVAAWYRRAGLILIVLIYLWAYLTAKDVFWAGKATFFGMFVLFGVAILDLVIKNGMEES